MAKRDSMKKAPGDASGDVIDLLATWGATALPGMADLLAVLSEFGRADTRALVGTILETPGLALPGELQQEAALLVSAAAGDMPPDVETRLNAMVPRLEEAVRASVGAQRNTLRDELRSWGRLLGPAEFDPVLAKIWRHENAEELADYVSAARDLEAARALLGKARWRIDDDLRRTLEEMARSGLDAEVESLVRGALDGGDPQRIRAARRELAVLRRGSDKAREADGLDAARPRLAELWGRARKILDDPSATPDESARELLRLAIERADPLTRADGDGVRPADESLLQRIALWERALAQTLEGLADAPGGRGPDRSALAEKLGEEIRSELGEDGDNGELAAARRRLEEAVAKGGRPFVDALAVAAGALGERRERRRQRFETAAADLRNGARDLSANLERLASALPTERVVAARLLLERAEEATTLGNQEDVKSLVAEVRDEIEELHRLSDLSQKHQQSRVAGERKRLRSEANHLLRIARGRKARRINALVEQIDKASPKTLKEYSRELGALAAPLANAVRLEAAKALRRVESRSKSSDERIERLREAFDRDDLPAMAELGTELRKELVRSKMPIRIAAAAIGVALIVGLVWGTQWIRNRPHAYRLELSGDDPQTVTITLVRDGTVVGDALESRPGQPTTVRLKPGSYQVFVNERYTGRVIHAPDPPFEVTDIPVPPPPTLGATP